MVSTVNGIPVEEWNEQNKIWQEAVNTNLLKPELFNLEKLINSIASKAWMRQCEIIPDYLPPFAREDDKPRCVVKWCVPREPYVKREKGIREPNHWIYLRHSCGPQQGYFWDSYGSDFLYPELALVALSHAPAPNNCSFNFDLYK